MPISQGQVLSNRYRIVSLLGQGGFGAVYRAWDVNLKRPCAVKENLDTSSEAQEQFEREAVILARLIHPNLARVTDHFFVKGQGQYLVMDFVDGEDLHQMMERSGKPIREEDAVEWIGQICDALVYMHSQQPPIIHRDIKPANIKVTPEGNAMLVDFGIAKIYDPNLRTTVGARAVTPGYSPPEQYGQGKTDPRSDIYALGATTYTMLTRCVPPDSVDVLSDNLPAPEPVNELNPSVSSDLSTAVEKAMQVKRENRYDYANQFKDALTIIPQFESVEVVPGDQSVRPAMAAPDDRLGASDKRTVADVVKPAKRSKIWILAAGITLAALFVAAGLFLVFNVLLGGSAEGDGTVVTEVMPEDPEHVIVPGDSGDLTLMHYYAEDSLEHEALIRLVEQFQERHPGKSVNLRSVNRGELAAIYAEETLGGSGPDIVLFESDVLNWWAEDSLVLPLWSYLDIDLDPFHWAAVDSMIYNDELYGLPLSPRTVGLYINYDMIPNPPEDIELLFEHNLKAAPLSSSLSAYFLTGFFGSFGASLLDDEGRCIVDQTGGVEALWYLKELYENGALIIPEYAEAERLFLDGESGMIINGPWVLTNYREHFHDALDYVSLPVGPGGLGRPLLNFRGLFVNPNSENIDVAVELVKFLSSQEAAQTFSDVALLVPVRWDVEMRDPIQQGFFDGMDHGDLSMKNWEYDNYSELFTHMFIDVLESGADPDLALAEACAAMNEMNGK